MSMPSNMIRAGRSACSRRTIARPVVVLPQPDSPTSPSVSPRRDREADAVDGPHVADVPLEDDALRDREPDLEVLDATSSRRHGRRRGGAWRARRRRRRRVGGTPSSADGSRSPGDGDRSRPGRAVSRPVARSVDDSSRPRRRRRGTNPSRSGRPAAASSAVGGLWQATRCVASGPVVTTRTPASSGLSGGLSVQQTGSRQAQRGANGQPDGRVALVRRRALDRDQRLGLAPRRAAGSSGAARPCTGATASANSSCGRRGLDDEARRT